MSQTDLHTEVQRWRYKRLLQPEVSHGEHRLRMLFFCILSAVLFPVSATSGPQIPSPPRLSVASSDIAPAGFSRLNWKTDAERVDLQEATYPGFRNPTAAYPGPDQAPSLILNIITQDEDMERLKKNVGCSV
jgi:hypothetical protein